MVRQQYRAALWLLVLAALVTSSLAAVAGAQAASSTSYALTGYVEEGTIHPVPVPAGVHVDLISQSTGQVFTATTVTGGQYKFTSSSTGGALGPGYWGISVPAQANATLPGCNPTRPFECAILPTNQSPVFRFLTSTNLTSSSYEFPTTTGVSVLPYIGNLTGNVTLGGTLEPGAQVSLLDPLYNGLSLVNNTTTSKGKFQIDAPVNFTGGSWVLKTVLSVGSPSYNLTRVTVANRTAVWVNPKIQNYIVSGTVLLNSGAHVPSTGNVTLFDPINGYLYSSPTPVGGYYSAGTYPLNFKSGPQTFDVVLSSVGYGTVWYPLNVSSPTPVYRNVYVSPVATSQLGRFLTTIDLSGINVSTGKGSVAVNTSASLGNDTVFPYLPNATVGQLWAQLGLDFNHSASFPSALLPAVDAFVNSTGPFFPLVQAQTTINGTGFLGPTAPQTLTSWGSACSGYCGLSSTANLTYRWSESYALNGSIPVNGTTYTLAFGFAHPASSSDVYNYTIVLPKGYVLAADTQAPSATRLAPAGTGGTWTSFTLQSLPSTTAVGSARFSVVKYAALTPIINATVSNFAFSGHNVLNSTEDNYTVEVGVGQNVTFSALNSLYPSGTNGTKFFWAFGDGTFTNTTTATTNHTYATASAASPYPGKLTITSSGGLTNSTDFFVWVAKGPVVATVSVNSTAKENRTAGSTPYVFVNWGTVLHFNASASTAAVSPTATVKGVLSVASFSFVSSKGFKQTANYSVAQGAYFGSNFTVQFLGAGLYLSSGSVGGTSVPFLGWQYNLTLTAWSGTGQYAKTTLDILVNDTEKPVSAFQLLTAAGKPIPASGVVAGTNLSTRVQLNGANATDPHNGSVVKYYWLVTNSQNTSFHQGFNVTSVKPYPSVWVSASTTAYTVNLTVWDRNGNSAYTTQSLTVSQNTTTSPIMAATNLTGPSSLNDGSSYTYWVNVTVGGGKLSTGTNVSVAFYLLSPSGSGSRNYIGSSPGSVRFYNYTSAGVPNTVPFATGLIASLAYNTTVRAVVTWNPGITGNFVLYANVTASNEFAGDTHLGPQTTSMSVTISPNPTTQLLEYVAIGVAVVVVLVLIVFYYRRRTGKGGTKGGGTGRSGLERAKRPAAEEEKDEDEEDNE